MTKVSILIPTYKRPDLLVEAVKSCLEQTYLPYELVIGDDSPDEVTAQVVEELKKESPVTIRYIHNKPSLKQARNINMLFNEAQGDKVMILHDDDLLMPESLETLVNVFERDPSVSVAFGKQYIITDTGEIDPESSITFNQDFYRIEKFEGTALTPFESALCQQFPNNGYLIKAEIIKKMQWNIDAGDACDYEFGYRLGLAGYKMYFVNKFLGKYRLSAESISHSRTSDCAYQAYHILSNSKPNSPFSEEVRAKRLYERAPIAITEAVNLGKRGKAVEILFSEWYRKRILSLQGIKRVLYILFYFEPKKLFSGQPNRQSIKKKKEVEYSL
ncbi:glycosyltransferase family 2 protein [Spirosoma fluviale]|uniref:Glycosyltransferase, GT2 family n=1 Tax=Spirosoma fluviale TaxID=1597977 RepID=A0A286G8W3_9BACT|nr:glycosyltransferase family 2 protein [Spirosoma fluviale]SOD91636.1 Glycosyltransferase, GT2 family [Spirosoma fluviale]